MFWGNPQKYETLVPAKNSHLKVHVHKGPNISPSLQLSETSSVVAVDMDKYSGICGKCTHEARVAQYRGFNETVIPSTPAY